MRLVIVRFISDRGADYDDVIEVYPTEGAFYGRPNDVYTVKFRTIAQQDTKVVRTCYMNAREFMTYLDTILDAIKNDEQPCENIQIDSVMSPSILYDAGDLGRASVRRSISELVGMGLAVYPMEG